MSEAIGYCLGLAIGLYPIYLFFRWAYKDIKKYMSKGDFERWEKKTLSTIGLYENGRYKVENAIFCANGSYSFMIYSIDKKLYFFDASKTFNEIKIESIMDIKVDTTVNTRNVKRLVALTSTYDTNSTTVGHLTIITESRNYVVNHLNDVNELNRFKMILEKHIKELNSANN